MSIAPVILMHAGTVTSRLTKTTSGKNRPEAKKIFDELESRLTPGRNFRFQIKQPDAKLNTGNRTMIAEVTVDIGENDKEKIYISYEKKDKDILFVLAPSSPSRFFEVSIYDSAEARTNAVIEVAQALFDITNANVAITIQDSTGNRPITLDHFIRQGIPHSRFSILRRNVFLPLEKAILGGGIKLAHLNSAPTDISWSVTNQPFAASAYNSSKPHVRPSPARAFHDAMTLVLNS